MDELLLGVDGGSSKTRALLATRSGALLGVGVDGASNQHTVGFDGATRAIQAAIAQAFARAGLPPTTAAVACLGIAGADRPIDHERFEAWALQQRLARRCVVVNDSELLLAAGTPDGWGVGLICGTGSICFGRTPDGRVGRAGGWGYLMGDEGSGYDIALRALRLATQTADGYQQAHAILGMVMEHWRLTEPIQLIGHVYRPQMTRADLAALAERVAILADAGDAAAIALIDRAAIDLARLVAAVVRKLDLSAPPLALGGGLFATSGRLREQLAARAGIQLGPLTYVGDPTTGALVIARRLYDAD